MSWRSGTVTGPASEPRSAGESSAAAHSHCEPKPCLQEANVSGVNMSKARAFLSPVYSMYAYSLCHEGGLTTHMYVYRCMDITSAGQSIFRDI